jgi:chemotaxis protein methyltransferase WspC
MGADPGPSPDQSPLQIARQLADNGQLTQAEAVCRTALQHSPSADGYALLGAILHAAKEYDAASQALRRALYLDPHHREALALAAGLAESAGNTTHAQLLRRRLASLTRTEPSGNAP